MDRKWVWTYGAFAGQGVAVVTWPRSNSADRTIHHLVRVEQKGPRGASRWAVRQQQPFAVSAEGRGIRVRWVRLCRRGRAHPAERPGPAADQWQAAPPGLRAERRGSSSVARPAGDRQPGTHRTDERLAGSVRAGAL